MSKHVSSIDARDHQRTSYHSGWLASTVLFTIKDALLEFPHKSGSTESKHSLASSFTLDLHQRANLFSISSLAYVLLLIFYR